MPTNSDHRNSAHRIRLAGPWELVTTGTTASRTRVNMPCSWADLPIPEDAEAIFRRSFHAPTGLSDQHRVFLELPVKAVQVCIDGQPVESDGDDLRFEISAHLNGFHLLEIRLAGPPGLEEPVWLVIEEFPVGA